MEYLNLPGINLTGKGKEIAGFIQNNEHIKGITFHELGHYGELWLNKADFTSADISDIFFIKNSHLESLDLSEKNLSGKGKEIAHFIQNNKYIKKISLWQAQLTPEDISEILSVKTSYLKSLDLSYNNLSNKGKEIAQFIINNPHIKEIIIENDDREAEGLLAIKECELIPEDILEILSIKESQLTFLYLGEWNLSNKGAEIAEFINNNKHLYNIELGGVELMPDNISAILSVKNSGLRSINLSEYNLADKGKEIADFILNNPYITAINLNNTHLSSDDISAILSVKNSGLKEIILSSNNLSNKGAEIAEFINNNKHLYAIIFWELELAPDDISAILSVKNSGLNWIGLSSINLVGKGKEIADFIINNPYITAINLNNAHLISDDISAILSVKNSGLRSIDLSEYNIAGRGKEIAGFILNNPYLKNIFLRDGHLKIEDLACILSIQNSSLEYMDLGVDLENNRFFNYYGCQLNEQQLIEVIKTQFILRNPALKTINIYPYYKYHQETVRNLSGDFNF